jgi:DNA-binding NtrC family response regulator
MTTSVLQSPHRPLHSPTPAPGPYASLAGASSEHTRAVESCAELIDSGVRDVLLVGPPGSGKAHIARCMHNGGPRAAEAFLTIDCGALSAPALEADLFGRLPGGADGSRFAREGLIQLAGAGTVFLRRVDLLPFEFQPRLLGVLRDRVARHGGGSESFEVRCAFTASAGPGLTEMVEEGRFDRTLYEYLAVSLQQIPSLVERGDAPFLAAHFLDELASEVGGEEVPHGFSQEALDRLRKHKWPGNIRELRRAVRDAAVSSSSAEIDSADLRLKRHTGTPRRTTASQIHIPAGSGKTLEAIEAEAIEITLRQTGGNKSAAARILGVSRPRLQRKLDKNVAATKAP